MALVFGSGGGLGKSPQFSIRSSASDFACGYRVTGIKQTSITEQMQSIKWRSELRCTVGRTLIHIQYTRSWSGGDTVGYGSYLFTTVGTGYKTDRQTIQVGSAVRSTKQQH